MAGRRRNIPNGIDAMKSCPTCDRPRGNKRLGWVEILEDETVIGFTCPDCPNWREPIRRILTREQVRFRVVVDATAPGATQRRQVTRTFDSLEEARAFVEEARTEVTRSGSYAAKNETVATLVERSIKSRRRVREVTREGYTHKVQPVVALIGAKPVRDLTIRDVENLIERMTREGGKRGTPLQPLAIRAAIGVLAKALDMAVREGLATQNVARLVELPRQTQSVGEAVEHWPTEGRGDAATCEALHKFRLASATDERLAAAWWLSSCGLTRADILGLRWSDIDLDKGTVTIRQGRVALAKGGSRTDEPKSAQRRRTLPVEAFLPGTVALLKKMRANQAQERLAAGSAWVETGFVVIDELGSPLRPASYSYRFKRLCESAGLPPIRLHALRHTLALNMVAAGVNPADAAAWLGHTLEVFLATYLPETGASGIAAVAAAAQRRVRAM